jgi:hypothetical protein
MRPARAELGECIGEGSFGVVFSGSYRVSKGAPPLPVAFKRIKLPAHGLSAEVVAALTREVQAMQRLNHPNLLRLFCVCDDPRAVDLHGRELGMCLCLESCERGSLRDILKDAAVDLPWKVRRGRCARFPRALFLLTLMFPGTCRWAKRFVFHWPCRGATPRAFRCG